MYKGFVDGKKVSDIHKQLYTLTINTDKTSDFSPVGVYLECRSIIIQAKRKLTPTSLKNAKEQYNLTDDDAESITAYAIYGILHSIKADKRLNRAIYEEQKAVEGNRKEKILSDMLEDNKEGKEPIVFYLCSTHKDVAEDHKDYQGKIYIDEEWEKVIKDERIKGKIKEYCYKNSVKTIQYITHKPVWLITRPHCRHYFIPCKTNEVLKSSVSRLIKVKHAEKRVGDRDYLQTMESGVNTTRRKVLGELRNAELMLDKYKDRLATHQALYSVKRIKTLQDAIRKDKMLINRWMNYLKMLK